MKISIFFLLFSLSIFSDTSKQIDVISCDEDIKLIIDEENMTNEEILKAKDERGVVHEPPFGREAVFAILGAVNRRPPAQFFFSFPQFMVHGNQSE